MAIISYQKKEGRLGVLTVLVDEDPWRDIHTQIFGKKPVLHMCCKTLSELETQFPSLEYKGALAYSMKRLSLKSQPSSELTQCLQERLVSESTIERIISEVTQLGYINDQDWLESFVRRQIARNLGPQAIAMKLRAKGISREQSEEILNQLSSSSATQEGISRLLETKYRTKDLRDYKTKEKVIAALIRKGFAFQDIIQVMSKNNEA